MTDFWAQRYATDDYLFGTEPARFLTENPGYLTRGTRALAVADGEGRNSVHLAQKGLQVTAMDAVPGAVAKARKLAADRGVQVDFQVADLAEWDWQPEAFDMVVAIFIQFADPDWRARLFQGFKTTLKPGGLLLLHGYAPRQVGYGTGGPPHAENMYTTDLLARAFADFDILRLADYDRDVQEGRGHSGMSALVDLIARKPSES